MFEVSEFIGHRGLGMIVRSQGRFMSPLALGWVCAGLLVLTGAAGLVCANAARARDVAASTLALETPRPAHAVLPQPMPAPSDFSQHLVAGQPDSTILHALQGSALAAHVAVSSMQVQEHRSPQENSLGHTRITVEWHGRYQDIKKALADVLDRLPGVSIERLTLRRAVGPDAAVDAVVSLSAWSAPASQPSGAAQ